MPLFILSPLHPNLHLHLNIFTFVAVFATTPRFSAFRAAFFKKSPLNIREINHLRRFFGPEPSNSHPVSFSNRHMPAQTPGDIPSPPSAYFVSFAPCARKRSDFRPCTHFHMSKNHLQPTPHSRTFTVEIKLVPLTYALTQLPTPSTRPIVSTSSLTLHPTVTGPCQNHRVAAIPGGPGHRDSQVTPSPSS